MTRYTAENRADSFLNRKDLTEEQCVICLWMVGVYTDEETMERLSCDNKGQLYDTWRKVHSELRGKA